MRRVSPFPDPRASGAQVLSFYTSHVAAQSAGAFLQFLGFIAFVLAASVLRLRLRATAGGEGLAGVALVALASCWCAALTDSWRPIPAAGWTNSSRWPILEL
jgi:hypothetical protein